MYSLCPIVNKSAIVLSSCSLGFSQATSGEFLVVTLGLFDTHVVCDVCLQPQQSLEYSSFLCNIFLLVNQVSPSVARLDCCHIL